MWWSNVLRCSSDKVPDIVLQARQGAQQRLCVLKSPPPPVWRLTRAQRAREKLLQSKGSHPQTPIFDKQHHFETLSWSPVFFMWSVGLRLGVGMHPWNLTWFTWKWPLEKEIRIKINHFQVSMLNFEGVHFDEFFYSWEILRYSIFDQFSALSISWDGWVDLTPVLRSQDS